MGLIKTAMMAGAGMYAVNKVVQVSAQRRSSPQPQQQYPYQPQQQQYTDNNHNQQPQQSQRAVPMEFVDRRGSPSQQGQQPQQYLLTNDSSAHVPVYGYNAEGGYYFEIDPRSANASAPPAMAYASRGSPPPPQYQNYNAPRQQGGFVEPDELSVSEFGYGDSRGSRGGNGGSADMLGSLMQSVSSGKGKDLMSKFMK